MLIRTSLLLMALASAAQAQDRWQVGLSLDQTNARSEAIAGLFSLESKGTTGFGLMGAYDAAPLKGAMLRITAGVRFEGKGDLVASEGPFSLKFGDAKQSHISLGAEVAWKLPLEVGVGLQLRQERIRWTTVEDADVVPGSSTSQLRPWLTAHLGHSWKAGSLQPFVRGGVALALTRTRMPGLEDQRPESEIGQDVAKALAPTLDLNLQVGLRF